MAALNKTDIVNIISKNTGVNKKDVNSVLKSLVHTFKDALSKHETLRLTGVLTLKASHRNARTFRNPQTGKPIQKAAHYVPTFKPGSELRRAADNK